MKTYLIATTAVFLAATTVSSPASAQGYYPQGYYAQGQAQYDGYCYVRKQRSGRQGAVVGAVVGGLAGSQVSKNERGLGTVAGAVIGGAIGNSVGRSNVKCHDGTYYSYDQGYYDAPGAPDGYEVVYFEQRPSRKSYKNIRTKAPAPPYPHGGYQHGGGPAYDSHNRTLRYRPQPYIYGYETPAPEYYDDRAYAPQSQTYYSDRYDRGYTEHYDTQTTYSRHPHPSHPHSDRAYYGHTGYQSGYYTQSESSASSYSSTTRTYVNGVLVDQSSTQGWRGADGVWHDGPPPAGLFYGHQPY